MDVLLQAWWLLEGEGIEAVKRAEQIIKLNQLKAAGAVASPRETLARYLGISPSDPRLPRDEQLIILDEVEL